MLHKQGMPVKSSPERLWDSFCVIDGNAKRMPQHRIVIAMHMAVVSLTVLVAALMCKSCAARVHHSGRDGMLLACCYPLQCKQDVKLPSCKNSHWGT